MKDVRDVLILGELNAKEGTLNFKDIDGNIVFAMLPNQWLSIPKKGLSIGQGGYLNFGNSLGSGGYGIRDDNGEIGFRDHGGLWRPIDGKKIENVKVTAVGPTDDVALTEHTRLVIMGTVDNNVTIGAFTGGEEDQRIVVLKANTNNIATLENDEGTVNQNIGLSSGADESIGAGSRGGWYLQLYGNKWYEVNN